MSQEGPSLLGEACSSDEGVDRAVGGGVLAQEGAAGVEEGGDSASGLGERRGHLQEVVAVQEVEHSIQGARLGENLVLEVDPLACLYLDLLPSCSDTGFSPCSLKETMSVKS